MTAHFVTAPAPELTNYHPKAQIRIEMSPQRFLENLGQAGQFYPSRDVVDQIKRRMAAGQEIDPLFIDYDPFWHRIVRHEGRHRALAAKELGIDRIPVIVYFYDQKDWHDMQSPAGRVYDQTHYVSREELGEERINRIAERLGGERTYGLLRRPAQAGRRVSVRLHARGRR